MFLAFAAEISMAGLEDGSVDLLEIHQGEHRVGLLLNFVYRDRAMNYQSAFEEPLTPKAKPGLMAHAAAARHYAARGLGIYSLLAGADRYKQSLATGEDVLEWWMVERFSLKLSGEYWLRRLLRR
jgi:CelD/BcsL family acetyltransferase involved in cellulose biosynthesis